MPNPTETMTPFGPEKCRYCFQSIIKTADDNYQDWRHLDSGSIFCERPRGVKWKRGEHIADPEPCMSAVCREDERDMSVRCKYCNLPIYRKASTKKWYHVATRLDCCLTKKLQYARPKAEAQ